MRKGKTLISCLLTITIIFSILAFYNYPAYANSNDGYMAKNFYMDPDRSDTSGQYLTFSIDFKTTKKVSYTYWSLCNWSMNIDCLKQQYPNACGSGAYAGFQDCGYYGNKLIMSFWDILEYNNGPRLTVAECVYHEVGSVDFTGEGDGSSYREFYDWQADHWYRMVIHCWDDSQTGRTFVGQWVQDLESGEWMLVSYFDTKLTNSYIQGNLSQFMENYSSSTSDNIRNIYLKNIYVYDKVYNQWFSLNKAGLGYDPSSWGFKTRGTHELSYTDEYFYGETGGYVENQEEYDKLNPTIKGEITQLPLPDFAQSTDVDVVLTSDSISWSLDKTAAPQGAYEFDLVDADSSIVVSANSDRPHQKSYDFGFSIPDGEYTAYLKITDIFGREKLFVKSITTNAEQGTDNDTDTNVDDSVQADYYILSIYNQNADEVSNTCINNSSIKTYVETSTLSDGKYTLRALPYSNDVRLETKFYEFTIDNTHDRTMHEVTYILGDTTGDGKVNVMDAVKIQRVLAGFEQGDYRVIKCGAVLKTGGINVTDSIEIQKYLVKQINNDDIGKTINY